MSDKRSLVSRLYRGETAINFIGSRKWWYLASAGIVVAALLAILIRGFNFGIDFKGGSEFSIPISGKHITTSQVDTAITNAKAPSPEAAQKVGTDQIIVDFGSVSTAEEQQIRTSVAKELGVDPNKISTTTVGSSWGHDVSVKAIEGLIVFLIVVSIYIAVRFRWQMAVGALVGLVHDLVIAAGIYALVGFSVTPSTVVGLLTILGFSLYDTVVVFDKVAENAKDIMTTARMTFGEAANLAVNQTLMRSINTSLIGLLPVAGLLFVGVGVLGVGTIEDLALILFVGLAAGAYSSLFLCTPVVVDIVERDPKYKALIKRVQAKRSSEAKRSGGDAAEVATATTVVRTAPRTAAPAPVPGAKPQRKRK